MQHMETDKFGVGGRTRSGLSGTEPVRGGRWKLNYGCPAALCTVYGVPRGVYCFVYAGAETIAYGSTTKTNKKAHPLHDTYKYLELKIKNKKIPGI